MNGRRPFWKRCAGTALLFLFGLAVSLYYGRRGYMPLDQSIVFDGGWRILSGQVPFRDYHAPNGFAVHALQAVFFALCGVSWFTYCLHAAVVNGLFAVLVKHLLVRTGLHPAVACVYAALSALVLYPPFGVPYMDQHAFFFSLAAVALALDARRAEERTGRARKLAWIGLPAVLLAAGLSKQIPSAFAIPIVLAVGLVDARPVAWRRARGLALGALLAIGLLAVTALSLGVDPERIATYFWRLPSEEGARRYAFVPGLGPILERMRYTGEVLGLRSIGLVHAAGALGLLSLAALPFAAGGPGRLRLLAPLRAVLLAETLLVLCLLFIALTSNQPEIGVPYVFLAAGLIHVALERTRDSLLANRRVWLAAGPRLLALVLLGVALVDGWHFTRSVNATRTLNDITWSPEAAGLAAPRVHPELAFMGWQLPPIVPYGPAHLRDLVEFLERKDSPFLLIGDASIVYGLAGQPSVAPSLWFHHGLTLPMPEDPTLADYESLLLERIEALGVRFVVLEGEHTWIHTSLARFPRLEALVAERRAGSARFGGFEVIGLRPAPQSAGAKSP